MLPFDGSSQLCLPKRSRSDVTFAQPAEKADTNDETIPPHSPGSSNPELNPLATGTPTLELLYLCTCYPIPELQVLPPAGWRPQSRKETPDRHSKSCTVFPLAHKRCCERVGYVPHRAQENLSPQRPEALASQKGERALAPVRYAKSSVARYTAPSAQVALCYLSADVLADRFPPGVTAQDAGG
eukprot:1068565-Prorocentrum_minimum.AAC.2